MPRYPAWTFMLLPITRHELPAWGRLLSWCGAAGARHDHRWRDAPTRIVRGKWHGYRMKLHLADWAERYSFFLGRYYELETQLLLRAVLRPGDRFVDIGGNIGMMTLLGAHQVGPNGIVDCFEPNPECQKLLEDHLSLNGIKHVRLHRMALADTAGNLQLNVAAGHTGTGTLTALSKDDLTDGARSYDVPVGVGDQVLLADTRRVTLIKIDVEGFEINVLKGLRALMQRDQPMIVTEVVAGHLERAGVSTDDLFDLMHESGYRGYALSSRRRLHRDSLVLKPIGDDHDPGEAADVLWAHDECDRWSAVVPFIATGR